MLQLKTKLQTLQQENNMHNITEGIKLCTVPAGSQATYCYRMKPSFFLQQETELFTVTAEKRASYCYTGNQALSSYSWTPSFKQLHQEKELHPIIAVNQASNCSCRTASFMLFQRETKLPTVITENRTSRCYS
jgi:hypothetical protein